MSYLFTPFSILPETVGNLILTNSTNEITHQEVKDLQAIGSKYYPSSSRPFQLNPFRKKKILILSNGGGGGHEAAAAAAFQSLEKIFDVIIKRPFEHLSGDNLFNQFQKNGQYEMLELLVKMQPLAEYIAAPVQVTPHLVKTIEKENPDMIISVFPVSNYLTWEIAKVKKIPMLVLMTDIEARHFFNSINKPGSNFKVGVPFEDDEIKEPLRGSFTNENFITTGYPLRPDFGYSLEKLQPTIDNIRSELNIEKDDKVIMIMVGAQGIGSAIQKYTKLIANSDLKSKEKVHVIALCGKNEEVKQKVQNLDNEKINKNIKIHALGLKDGTYIASLMRFANGIITKPGGSTVNEVIASELRAIYLSDGILGGPWEGVNMNYAINKGWAVELQDEHFIEQVNQMINSPRLKIEHCPGRIFNQRLQKVVKQMLDNIKDFNDENPKQLKKLLKMQVRQLFNNYTFLEKLIYKLVRREVNEALDNLNVENILFQIKDLINSGQISNEDMKKFHNFIDELQKISKQVGIDSFTNIQEHCFSDEYINEIKHLFIQKLFPCQGKTVGRKIENFLIQYLLQNLTLKDLERFLYLTPLIVSASSTAVQNRLKLNP